MGYNGDCTDNWGLSLCRSGLLHCPQIWVYEVRGVVFSLRSWGVMVTIQVHKHVTVFFTGLQALYITPQVVRNYVISILQPKHVYNISSAYFRLHLWLLYPRVLKYLHKGCTKVSNLFLHLFKSSLDMNYSQVILAFLANVFLLCRNAFDESM